jgi:predicted phage terminase large subunit-like protein
MSSRLELIMLAHATRSFAEFVRQAWHLVEQTRRLQWNWHFDVLCEYLEAMAADGDMTRLIINMPPRFGKSLLASVLWPAWVWARQPSLRWVFASYSSGLSAPLSAARRGVLTSSWYQDRWAVRLASDQNEKTEFANTSGGRMIATSVGGTITGKGGDFLIIDDLQSPEMSESEAERTKVLRFFDETLSSRLDDKRRGRIVVIQQRTHQSDLTGHLLEQGGWVQLSLPAEFERRTVISLPVTKGETIKNEGDLLWPESVGRAELDAQKRQLGSYAYACQYLQNPIARGGNLFKEDWFGTFHEVPKFDLLVQSWDCAFKTGKENDYSACVTIGFIVERREVSTAAPGYYLVDAWRGKIEFVELKRKAIELNREWRPSAVLVEDTASGQSLLQELRSNTAIPIKGVKPDSDKYTRASSVTPAIEGGQFWLLEGAAWSGAYRAELTAFPGGAHDDFVDATVQALTYLRANPEPSILTYYKDLAGTARTQIEQLRNRWPQISDAELRRFSHKAGACAMCKVNLLGQQRIRNGLGQVCMPCAKKHDMTF